MSADFVPSFVGYTGVRPFRWWCQKVLPLVYDDSLSYYELLCKVVDYINNLIADVSATETNLDSLKDAFEQLQNYVDNYFENNFPERVDAKLDELVADGTLEALLGDYVESVTSSYTNVMANGLTISARKRGGFAWVYIHGRTTVELASSNAYVDLGTMPEQFYPAVDYLVYQMISHRYTGQLTLRNTGDNVGLIRLGYSYDAVDGEYENIPVNTNINFMLCYKTVDESISENAVVSYSTTLDNGVSLTCRKRNGMAWIYVHGVLTNDLLSEGAYVTLDTLPEDFQPNVAFLVYQLVNHRFTCQLSVTNARNFNIGYSFDTIDGTYKDIASGQRLNFMFCYETK